MALRRHIDAQAALTPSRGCSDEAGAVLLSEPPPAVPADLHYDLPGEAIAQKPLEQRDHARLLVDLGGGVEHRRARDLPELVGPGDLLVVNDTRVLPARLRLRRATGGAVEVLLLAERPDGAWEALVRPSRRLRVGEVVTPQRGDGSAAGAAVEVGADLGEGRRVVRVHTGGRELHEVLAEIGTAPLPPYIRGDIDDPERYQTVYARRPLSAAAPTAGLHFTEGLLERIRGAGAAVVAVELVVGLDTFRPVTAARLEDHRIHTERYRVPEAARAALARSDRVIAVGTTVARCLETWALTAEPEGRTGLFIRRPFRWRAVDALMTNFHLPRSTLLCLLDAFIGPRWRDLYSTALAEGYRFLSFGDAMLVARRVVAAPGC